MVEGALKAWRYQFSILTQTMTSLALQTYSEARRQVLVLCSRSVRPSSPPRHINIKTSETQARHGQALDVGCRLMHVEVLHANRLEPREVF